MPTWEGKSSKKGKERELVAFTHSEERMPN